LDDALVQKAVRLDPGQAEVAVEVSQAVEFGAEARGSLQKPRESSVQFVDRTACRLSGCASVAAALVDGG
jgi:hypothetical protein